MTSDTPRGIQTWIHYFEEGAGILWIKAFLLTVCAAAAIVAYHFMEARNFTAPEAMDQAQLGRNIAEGRGFTTWYIRPLSIHLLQDKARAKGADVNAVLRTAHPDLENTPLYPVLLAGLFKALPMKIRNGVAAEPVGLHRLPPEMAVGWLNVGLFIIVVVQVYRLGRLVFDPAVAFLAAAVTAGTEQLWRFAYSGLSTMLLMVLVLAVAHLLVVIERGERAEARAGGLRQVLLALLAGLVLGAACLTRYQAGLLLVPAILFLLLFTGGRRGSTSLAAVLAFTLVVSPWLVRNWSLSGQPFGTAGYALFAGTESFPADRLERSFDPKLAAMPMTEPVRKGVGNVLSQLQDDLPRLGGGWLSAFFLVGLLVPFRDPSLGRLRWFVLGSLAMLFLAQAAWTTSLSEMVPVVNSENLLVLAVPLVFLFGSAMFMMLLDHIEFPFPLLRSMTHLAAMGVFSLPLVIALAASVIALPGWFPRRQYPLAEPYRPSVIRELSNYTPTGSLMVSDIPWAVAWYGYRECVRIPLRVQESYKEDFFVVHDYLRPVQAVYISPFTANSRWHSSFWDADHAWFNFFLDVSLRQRLPDGFPLLAVHGPSYVSAGHLFCAEKPWWVRPANR